MKLPLESRKALPCGHCGSAKIILLQSVIFSKKKRKKPTCSSFTKILAFEQSGEIIIISLTPGISELFALLAHRIVPKPLRKLTASALLLNLGAYGLYSKFKTAISISDLKSYRPVSRPESNKIRKLTPGRTTDRVRTRMSKGTKDALTATLNLTTGVEQRASFGAEHYGEKRVHKSQMGRNFSDLVVRKNFDNQLKSRNY